MVNSKSAAAKYQVITGRRVKHRSLKIVQENELFLVVYTVYFLGLVLTKKTQRFNTLAEAEKCYEEFAFKKFKGRI